MLYGLTDTELQQLQSAGIDPNQLMSGGLSNMGVDYIGGLQQQSNAGIPLIGGGIIDESQKVVHDALQGNKVISNIPQWLQDMAQSGYGTKYYRSTLTKAGEKVSTQTLNQERSLQGMGAIQGVSSAGYVQPIIAGLEKRKKRALIDMEYAVKSQNESAKRKALATINAIKYQTSQINNMLSNQSEREKLANMLRTFQEQYTKKQLEANAPLPWYEQLAGAGLSYASMFGGMALAAAL